MSFDEWKERQESLGNEVDSWSAWAFQQTKIDELQKRIDGALEKCYTGIRKQGGDYYLELVESILKGEK